MPEGNEQKPPATAQTAARPVATSAQLAQVIERGLAATAEGETGPNASANVENPSEHYVLAADGKTKINAYGEEKGSPEDKRRMAAIGFS